MVSADYLARALVLHRSLVTFEPDLRLHVCCLDDLTLRVLSETCPPGVRAFALAELEAFDPALPEVRPRRTAWEYAMTLKPSLCRLVLERALDAGVIGYADADLMFFGDPSALLDELGDGSALLVPHRYPPEREWMARAWGVHNAGTILLRRTAEADQALGWWRERCLDWCHRAPEDGRWADQKYLDDWPRRYPGVRVLAHPGGGLAPWNGARHELRTSDGAVLVDRRPLVFYHHQGLRLHRGVASLRRVGLLSERYRLSPGRPPVVWRLEGKHSITAAEERLVWAPYLRALAQATADVRRVDPAVPTGFGESLEVAGLRRLGRRMARRAVRAARRARRCLRRRSKRARRMLRRAVRLARRSAGGGPYGERPE